MRHVVGMSMGLGEVMETSIYGGYSSLCDKPFRRKREGQILGHYIDWKEIPFY